MYLRAILSVLQRTDVLSVELCLQHFLIQVEVPEYTLTVTLKSQQSPVK
jgi:hypothetical protein